MNLQIAGIKIPRETEKQILKFKLPHSPHPENRDICLFVKDLEKGIKVDHEDTIRHFTDLLSEKGVKGITQVISLRELKVEYKQFEAKIQLANKFDLFLADDRIFRLLPVCLGKNFYKRKKIPLQINLRAKDLAGEVARCVATTQLPLTNTGSCSQATVGTTRHSAAQLAANIAAVSAQLVAKYPGGWRNVRSVTLNSGTCSLPLYASLRATAAVGLVSGAKRGHRALVTDELSTVVGGEVTVTPFGNVRVKRKADPNWTEEDETLQKFTKEENKRDEEEEEEEVKEKPADESKDKKSTKHTEKQAESSDEDSEDDMEDQELEYMKKVAEEEEEMEKKLEATDAKLSESLLTAQEEESEDESEDDVDDDIEAENLLSDDEDTDDEDELTMKKTLKDIDAEIEADPPVKNTNKKADKKQKKKLEKASKTSDKNKSAPKALKAKDKKQKKFIEKKKKEKGGKKNQ